MSEHEKAELQVGDIVRARERLAEEIHGKEVLHANVGDLGCVIDRRPGFLPTVEFLTSGTVYDCAPEELEIIARPTHAIPPERLREALQ